ncbi:MAG: NAD-dependent epimerase/dehydratase family protein [Pseudomonadota bacterium]
MLRNKRILITGGAGFIGSHLCKTLAQENQVVVLDNLHRNALQPAGLDKLPSLELKIGDVTDPTVVRSAIAGCTHVVHLAAIAGVDTVIKNPVLTMRIAMLGTLNVLEAALEQNGIECLVDFSTSEVFGSHAYNVTEGDVTTLGAVGEARWTYAVSKLATEHLCFNYFKQHGLPTCSIRPFNIYGPMQVGEGAVHHFIVRALKGDPLHIHNDGGQIRAWCYVDDIIRGTLMVLDQPKAIGHSFNIGNPRSTVTIYHLAQEIIRLAGSSSRAEFVNWPHPDVELRIPNIDKARQLVGYEPAIDLEEGLRRTIAWYREKLSHS